ncbi:MAG: aldolase/citrate lyase family protein, partial [Stellaceae bacterium]
MRSFLFVPADSERKLARAPESGADALILDLEDSVVPQNRPLARSQARAFSKRRQPPRSAVGCVSTRSPAIRH